MEKCGIIFPAVRLMFRPQVLMATLLVAAFLFFAENSIAACDVDNVDCDAAFLRSTDAGDRDIITGEMQPMQKEMAFAIFRPTSFSQTWGVCFTGRQQPSKASQWSSPSHMVIHDCFHSRHFKQSFFSNASTRCCVVRPHAFFCRYLN